MVKAQSNSGGKINRKGFRQPAYYVTKMKFKYHFLNYNVIVI